MLLPFVMDAQGAFLPRDPEFNPTIREKKNKKKQHQSEAGQAAPRRSKRRRDQDDAGSRQPTSPPPPSLTRTFSSSTIRGPYPCADPTRAFSKLFDQGAPPKRGGTRLSCEEGLIIRLSKLATNPHGNGQKPFNRWLSPKAAAGLLAAETYRRMARACIIHSARAAVTAMRRHRGNIAHGFVSAPN